MNHIDITFDLETCATTANAAVMQVAAVAWDRYANDNPFAVQNGGVTVEYPHCVSFNEHVDLRSCVVDGFDFDPATVQWWARQSDAAKEAVTDGLAEPIREVFERFVLWIKQTMRESKAGSVNAQADSVCLWCQGMDFDGAILRNICHKYDIELPFRYQQFRDCRSIILEAAATVVGRATYKYQLKDGSTLTVEDILQKPCKAYDIYEPLPEEYGSKDRVHDAVYDCIRSSWNTWQALRRMQATPDSI